jgi:hypothetical protein
VARISNLRCSLSILLIRDNLTLQIRELQMASFLQNLPRELQLEIADSVANSSNGHAAILEWSCACSFYRTLLAPYVFKTVSLHNDEKSASTLLGIARGRYNEHVKSLVYSGITQCPHKASPMFPSLVNDLLSQLRQFACLNSVTIRFPSLDCLLCENGRTLPPKPAEIRALAHSLMSLSFQSLAQNEEHQITALRIKDLQLIAIPTYFTDPFYRFLHGIQRFQLSLEREEDYWWDYCENREIFAATLGLYFFDPLYSVLEFVFEGCKTGTVALTGFGYGDGALSRHQMPLLKRVHLERIYLCPGLGEFLVAKSTTLESIVLCECSASLDIDDGLGRHGITWGVLFKKLSNSKPSKLQKFTVTPHNLLDVYDCEEPSPDDLEVFTSHPERRVFRYTDPNWTNGFEDINAQEIVRNFVQGEDQNAHEELMEIVHSNVSRLSKS